MAAELGSPEYVNADFASLLDWLRTTWLLLSTFLLVSMQLGFCMLEVGSCREEHRDSVVMKNVLDSSISIMAFWIHSSYAPMTILDGLGGVSQSHLLAFNSFFCATCVTICSGSMSERIHMGAYACYAFLMAGVIYPILAEAVWGSAGDSFFHQEFHNRWFGDHHYHDFAGSGVVHLVGGSAALAGNMLLGRRIFKTSGRDTSCSADDLDIEAADVGTVSTSRALPSLRPAGGWMRRFCSPAEDEVAFKQCSYLQVMGMFTLWFGWYGFNCGSTWKLPSFVPGAVAWNTTLAASAGALGSTMFALGCKQRFDVTFICNGILSGLVAITAACDVARPVESFLIGLIAGAAILPSGKRLANLVLLDDPVDAVPVHALCGFFGVLAVAFCTPDCPNIPPNQQWPELQRFCSSEHGMKKQFVSQAWGALVQIGFTVSMCSVLWIGLVVSESVRAAEAPAMEAADKLLSNWEQAVEADDSGLRAKCWELADKSTVLADVLKAHGWKDAAGFSSPGQRLESIGTLRAEVRRAAQRVETGLEIHQACWVQFFVSLAMPFSRCAVARLRITPASEISGTGCADVASGQLARALANAAGIPTKESCERARMAQDSLLRQVRELSTILRVQQEEIKSMSTWRARQYALPVQKSPFNPKEQKRNGLECIGPAAFKPACKSRCPSTNAASTCSEASLGSAPSSSGSSPRGREGCAVSQVALNDLAHQLIDAIRQQQQQQSMRFEQDEPSAWQYFQTASSSGPGSSV